MQPLTGHHVVLGVSGGIASYKSAILARRLIDAGADVRVVMTAGAQAFVTPLTFQALTGNPTHIDLLDTEAEAAMGHIELARWADSILIAPASANVMARLATGMANDLLTTICLATEAQLFLAPAMNRIMWQHPATQSNLDVLHQRHVTTFGPDAGLQACGETGAGRMLEPEAIVDALIRALQEIPRLTATPQRLPSPRGTIHKHPALSSNALHNTTVMLTAGPTVEAIDPVRYLSNNSSGKMGFALAAAAAAAGARVKLIAGPVSLDTPAGVERVDVVSAADMHAAVHGHLDGVDIFISVAAVADYKPVAVAEEKIKKSSDSLNIELTRNPDILASVSALDPAPFCVGFAAETEHVEAHARGKLEKKNLAMIAANHVSDPDKPVFGADHNALDVFWPPDGQAHIPYGSKDVVATALITLIAERLTTATDITKRNSH